MDNFIVITGGPGAGKSALIAELAARGYATAPEAGRAILQHQALIGGPAGHTADQRLYAELMLSWEMRSYDMMRGQPGPVFFDRSLAELTHYLPLVGLETPPHIHRAARLFRYNPRVFIAPPWREIYATDTERKQDWSEAVRSHDLAAEAYRANGYTLVELPRIPTAARADFVLAAIAGKA
ncbi:MAG: AAA family ATPase [Micropepsaceae bacterium]